MSTKKEKHVDALPGERVRVAKGRQVFEGLVMPSTTNEMLVLKLDSGYDVGVSPKDAVVEKLPGKQVVLGQRPTHKMRDVTGIPNVSMISTGGTISARVDYKTGGVKPALSPEEIFFSAPELEGVVNFKSISSPFTVFSENMSPEDWVAIAKEAAKELNHDDVSGLILTHGTDTLHYTASALSFMLGPLPKPVALAGAQRSPDRGSFDGTMNLLCSARYAGYGDIAEAAIVMHGTTSDDYCIAIRGTKARKMHTTRRDAFRPVNDIPLAKIWPEGRIEKLQAHALRREGKVKPEAGFEEKTALIKAYPGAPPGIIDYLVDKKYKGIVVEATALGHVPAETLDKKLSWIPAIKNAIDKGVVVAFATQCIYGRTDPFVYDTARLMHSLGVVYCGDMLAETAYVKLGWLLATQKEKARELMLHNYAGELNPRLTDGQFMA